MSFPQKWPSRTQWNQLFKVLNQKEKRVFSVFLFGAIVSFGFLLINFYFNHTEIRPALGGEYTEALVGQPRFLNPIYGLTNDVDRDLVELLFTGLMKYDPDGKIIPELAKEYRILEEGRVYEFDLKENIFWEDGEPLNINDIIFTIETIQNPDFKSPQRVSWLEVEVEKVSDRSLRFKLKKPSAIFLEQCTLKIIPEHIWKTVSPQNFPLTLYNLKPIGSGPYKLKNLLQTDQGKISSLTLIRNPRYFGQGPNIPKITFFFYDSEEELLKEYSKGEIKGFTLLSVENLPKINLDLRLYSLSLPRYFAIFFNLEKSKVLVDEEVRKALNYGTNKEEMVEKILFGHGKVIHSPILPQVYGFKEPSEIYQFDLEKAKEILEKAGFIENEEGKRIKMVKKKASFQLQSNLGFGSKGSEVEELQKCLARFPDVYPDGTISGYFGQLTKEAVIKFQEKYAQEILIPSGLKEGTGEVRVKTREKLNELCYVQTEEIPLEISLITVEQPLMVKTTALLKEQWEKLGLTLNIQVFDISTIERDIIKKRDYETLLFGEILGSLPDPYPFWHSSQKRDPGLNLAFYSNGKIDKLLEEIRQNLDAKIRKEKLEEFQEILIKDGPAVFLYSPDYLYLVSSEIKGIKEGMIVDPSRRLSDIENWYIKTKRAWK